MRLYQSLFYSLFLLAPILTGSLFGQRTVPARKKLMTQVARTEAGPLTATVSARGLTNLLYKGTDFNYVYGEPLFTSVSFRTAGGEQVRGVPVCRAATQGTPNVDTILLQCTVSGRALELEIKYEVFWDTILTHTTLRNLTENDAIESSLISAIGIKMAEWNMRASKPGQLDVNNVLSWMDFGNGRWLTWSQTPDQGTLSMICGWANVCKTQVNLSVPAGSSKSYIQAIRFTDDQTTTPTAQAPEAGSAYRTAFPPTRYWPDRRPIVSWFIAEYSRRSERNPRGYLQDANLDARDPNVFRTRMLATATRIRDLVLARPVRPQGIIIWDLEGQEFIHATTYIGDPTALAKGYAPEMNLVADDLFALFRDAGLRVGVTLRPQWLGFGREIPETGCQFDKANDFKEYFIKVDAPFQRAFHGCYDEEGKKFSLVPNSNGGQTFFRMGESDKVAELLLKKARYAKERWGATIFYVDTSIWSGGRPLPDLVFRRLLEEMPDCLFIPEQEALETIRHTIPFADPRNAGDPRFGPISWRNVYEGSGIAIRLPDCQGACWQTNLPAFLIGQKSGDIPLYNQPTQMNVRHLDAIEELIRTARREMAEMEIVDSKSERTLRIPGPRVREGEYPVRMEVAFAASLEELAANPAVCRMGLLGETRCSLELAPMRHYQVRYVDFEGREVGREEPVNLPQ